MQISRTDSLVSVPLGRKVPSLGSLWHAALKQPFQAHGGFPLREGPKDGPHQRSAGTGFFIGLEAEGIWYLRHYYAVTCYHVAVRAGASILRINTKDGGSRFIELEPHEWQFIRDGDDMCAVDITDRLTDQDEYSVIPPNLVTWKDFITQEQVEIGEDGFMLGLFADHAGKKQNLIAARFGNLSLLARDDEPIEQPNGQKRPSHIFDMRSRPGFSGSPVFIYRTPPLGICGMLVSVAASKRSSVAAEGILM